jgi:hypothetical protein
MDNSGFIQEVRKHIGSGYTHFPENTPTLLEKVRNVIADPTTSPEQKAELISLEKALFEFDAESSLSFPGASARSL